MNIPVIVIIIAAGLIVYLYYQLEQTKSQLRKLPAAAKEIDDNIDALEVEVFILRRALLNVVRGSNETVDSMANAKTKKELEEIRKAYHKKSFTEQTASIYLANIYNTGHTTELLKKIYREHNLPEQFSSHIAWKEYEAISGKQIDSENWKTNNDKYEKMLTRMLTTDFENMQDEMQAERKQQREIENETAKKFGV